MKLVSPSPRVLPASSASSAPRYLTLAMYKFVALPDFAALRAPLLALCNAAQVKGTLLLASEGINGTIAGPPAGVRAVLAHLQADARFASLQAKESWSAEPPFLRMKVRLKKEIVTLGVPGVSPVHGAGEYVKPQDWNALISDPDVLVVDTRNDYEVGIGTFAGAVDPRIKTFADLPAWVAQQEEQGGLLNRQSASTLNDSGTGTGTGTGAGTRHPKVAMFCTGGIRCEKSTALLRMHGYDDVYHLEGGILKYLETVPPENSLWQGECFVFDERVSVGHGLVPGDYELCRSCRRPVGDADRASPRYVKGVSCAQCHDTRSVAQKQGFAERHRQVQLAQARGVAHVGAQMQRSTVLPGNASSLETDPDDD